MTDRTNRIRDDDRGSWPYQQNITAPPGSTLYIGQGSGSGLRSGSRLERVRALSSAATADSDIVAWRDGQSVVRLSDGAYVARSVEGRLLKRLAKPSVTAVVGEAGCGKSALLWHVHDRLVRAGYDPMLVPATALLDGLAVEEVAAALREPPDRGPVILLVDTLDLLLHDLGAQEKVNRLLRAAAESRVPTLVTSRPMEARMLNLAEEDDSADAEPTGERILKVLLSDYDRRERTAAIAAYARLFYSPRQVPEVAQVLQSAQVRGLPLQEVCRNPLALRLLFELYAPDRIPPEDVDSISLFDQYWQRRVADDRRGASGARLGQRAADLSRIAEAVGLVLLSSGSIESSAPQLEPLVAPLARVSGAEVGDALEMLRARGVLKTAPNSKRLRMFHQTFFEHTAARAVLAAGPDAVRVLLDDVRRHPHDLFYGEVASQLILLADRLMVEYGLAQEALNDWMASEDRSLRVLAARTYARLANPSQPLMDTAAAMLRSSETDVLTDFLGLLPSVGHPSFDRIDAELELVWDRAASLRDDPSSARAGAAIAAGVLNALARLAGAHPEAVVRFLTEHECVAWVRELPVDDRRNGESLYLRVLEPLYPHAPRWCGPLLVEFLLDFAAKGKVDGIAEIIEAFNRHIGVALDGKSAEAVVNAIAAFSSSENAQMVELEYARFRAQWWTGASQSELLAATRSVLGDRDRSTTGRRAELRALSAAALVFDVEAAKQHLDALLAETDRARQEDVCTVLGEAFGAAEGGQAPPLTRYVRLRCAEELSRLPVRRNKDGSRPLPMLFVNALYGARIGGSALRAALPDQVPDNLWSDPNALMPLLTPAALAGHPGAVGAMTSVLTGTPNAGSEAGNVRKAVLGRLREASAQGSSEAFNHLLQYAEATRDTAMLEDVLRQPVPDAGLHVTAFRTRLDRLREILTSSANRTEVTRGFSLWRLLVELGLGSHPGTDEVVARLADAPGYPLLISLLLFTESCLHAGVWADADVSPLVDGLRLLAVRDAERFDIEISDTASEGRFGTVEAQARTLLVGLLSRYTALPDGAARQLVFARRVLDLIRDAEYDPDAPRELEALTGCLNEMGRLLDRIEDPTVLVDIVLETAEWLHALQPNSTRWRRRTAHSWHTALFAIASSAPAAECRRLVTGLLATDVQMSRLAVAACVERIRPIPDWLEELAKMMPHDVYKRMRGVMKANAREGSPRRLPELYALAGPVQGLSR